MTSECNFLWQPEHVQRQSVLKLSHYRLGRWRRTLLIKMACDSPLDFTIWAPGRRGAPRAPAVDGYLVLAAPEFDQELASISRNSSRFVAWAQQSTTRDTLIGLTTARDDWRLELHSGNLEWTDYTRRDDEFTSPAFARWLTLLTELASSLEHTADGTGHPAPGDTIS